jgi:hypothetical protein
MPKPHEILTGLTQIANEAFAIAVAWHVIVAIVFVAAALGWRIGNRSASLSLSALLASVSMLAWAYGNPFNGVVFAVIASALAWFAWRAPRQPLRGSAAWSRGVGVTLIAFAWTYPHFLVGRAPSAYLYGAPLGTIPCPTLAFATGTTLLVSGLGTRGYRFVLAAAAGFYALFGMFRLDVAMDAVLLVGAAAVLVRELGALPALADVRDH